MSAISRRKFFAYSLGAAATAGVTPAPLTTLAHAAPLQADAAFSPGAYLASVENATAFLNQMMDAYAGGSTVRFIQSYSDQSGLWSTAFTYDNAVAIHAYLLHGTPDALARAQVLGDGLVYAQASNFPFADGRFAQAYFSNTAAPTGQFITPAAFPFFFYTSAVGDQAWAGMALAQLYLRTHNQAYFNAALNVANWIVANTYDTSGAGGFRFGTNINQFNQSVPSPNGKSTEHNIDTYAFFTMLDRLTHGGAASNGMTWHDLAAHARAFVIGMYNSTAGYFFTGTLGDQVSINYWPIPEDVQTWSYLALQDSHYRQTIDWALKNLQTTDTSSARASSLTGSQSFTGMVFDSASLITTAATDDPNAVWLEGTAHTIAALIARSLDRHETIPARLADLQTVLRFTQTCENAQAQLGIGQTVGGSAIPTGNGLVASTSVMDTGFGYTYGPSKHIGATGWYLIASHAGNPFQLGYRS
jgi:hypothetical protein